MFNSLSLDNPIRKPSIESKLGQWEEKTHKRRNKFKKPLPSLPKGLMAIINTD